MASKRASFHGAFTALVTPMRGGQVDYPALTRVVEDQIAADQLIAMGCDAAQGYHFSRPLSPEAFQAWLEQRALPERVAELPEDVIRVSVAGS